MRIRRWAVRWLAIVALLALALPLAAIAVLRGVRPPLTTYMAVRAVVARRMPDYRWMSLRNMSPQILKAVVAAEDARFMQHRGFDWTEMQSAVRASQRGRRLRGASTISMQCARSLFLWPGRSAVRKGIEAYLTVLLEALWPKARILEMYLNIVEWGDGIFGCEAAAQRYFQTSCADLDTEQAARLAAILPNPRRWSASQPGRYVRKRVLTIRDRMTQVALPRGR
ncbi:MAG: monofunctional biosynthetic peptidoglycan transglycosylase [Candidatus Binatia bacterium]